MKQTLLALHEAIELSIKPGKPVPLHVDEDQRLLENLTFTLGCSATFVELPDGGSRIEGKDERGNAFTTELPIPDQL